MAEFSIRELNEMLERHLGRLGTKILLITLAVVGPLTLVAVIINLTVGPWNSQLRPSPEAVGPITAKAEMLVKPWAAYHIDGQSRLQAYVEVKNSGDAIADITSWRMGVSVLEADIGDSAGRYTDLGVMDAEPGSISFEPGQSLLRFREFGVLSKEEVKSLKTQAKRIYVFGLVTYNGPEDERRQTGFCHTYSGGEHDVWPDGTKLYIGSQMKSCKNPDLNFRK